ncbi:hypothetical protein KAI04_03210 [Candidatus Pacearchaeota archaeon]|nr:hypothetical protein [Candidatus Pacearchaeota archaeon]
MDIKQIKKYENKKVRVFLNTNDYTYILDSLQIIDDEVEGFDIKNRKITLSPEIIIGIIPLSGISDGQH